MNLYKSNSFSKIQIPHSYRFKSAPAKKIPLIDQRIAKLRGIIQLCHIDRNKEKNYWSKISKELSSDTHSIEDIEILIQQLNPQLKKDQKNIENDFSAKNRDLSLQYKEAKKLKKIYSDPLNRGKLKELNNEITNIENRIIVNLENQKGFFEICLEMEKSQNPLVNVDLVKHYIKKIDHFQISIIALKTKQHSRILNKELSSSREILKTFDAVNNELRKSLTYVLSIFPQEFGTENLKNKTLIEKELMAKYTGLLNKLLSTPRLEEDLHKELRKLESMQGSNSASSNLAVAKNIKKIKERLNVLHNLRELQIALENPVHDEKMDVPALQVVGYMLVVLTSYKTHDSDYISQQLALITNFMEEHPKSTIFAGAFLGKWVLLALVLLVANLTIDKEMKELEPTIQGFDLFQTQLLHLDELFKTANKFGMDITEHQGIFADLTKNEESIKGHFSEIKKIQNETGLDKQAKIAQKQCDEIQKNPDGAELLSNAHSYYEKIFNPYYHRQVFKSSIEIENPVHINVIHKTYDQMILSKGDKLPEFVNSLKEGGIVCAAIRYHHVKSAAEIQHGSAIAVNLIKSIQSSLQRHIDQKNQEYSQQSTSWGFEGNRKLNDDFTEMNKRIEFHLNEYDKKHPVSTSSRIQMPDFGLMHE
ncbi:MAG: hypothetical protein H0T62_12295 [Parachlamydiaceae bacterium]|nr:hypothetical protein [Parachlamydiaceae bacterium]